MVFQEVPLPTTNKEGEVRGRRILVTGASSGIGSATAELLSLEGAIVGIHYHKNQSAAKTLRHKIQIAGGKAEIFEADLLKLKSRARLIPMVIKRLGGMDGLVNNAGAAIHPAPVQRLDENSWRQTFILNVEAPFFLAQAALAHMSKKGGGRIVNISSIGVKFGGSSKTLHYAAAKSALETVTIGLAKAGAPHGVLVNAIRPGVIETPLHEDKSRKEWQARMNLIPLKRAGRPLDIARMVLYLLSSASDFITGQVFSVSGGE